MIIPRKWLPTPVLSLLLLLVWLLLVRSYAFGQLVLGGRAGHRDSFVDPSLLGCPATYQQTHAATALWIASIRRYRDRQFRGGVPDREPVAQTQTPLHRVPPDAGGAFYHHAARQHDQPDAGNRIGQPAYGWQIPADPCVECGR